MFSTLGLYNPNMSRTSAIQRRYRRNTRLVLADPEQIEGCWYGEEHECLRTEDDLNGIEAWRLLSFWYWDNPRHPFGGLFTLSPFPHNDNYFLPLSIELTCRRFPYIAPSLRPRPPQAYLLAKQIHYLDSSPEFVWTIPALVDLEHEFGISVVAGMVNDDEETATAVQTAGLQNLGQLGKTEFYKELANSFVLIGVGRSKISPSPWDGLCMGLPFINPVVEWDENDPDNRTKWVTQQWHMTDLEPPYVYSVKAHDLHGLRAAVHSALTHPINSYIPDNMSFKFVTARLAEVIDGDWRGKAEKVLTAGCVSATAR
ncbi:hypothetical protein EHS25_000001 [Saitozyma podzolica]|uniref:Glycosyltransferase family 18 catalytic domain-containing protein n=1 Tax=Saitozyma podzolica TaxID=1890683 RepID=A0A427YUZ8_9TREE|nr:hypothetical protein EHS25_000001 [Saitozyma podzolica]